MILKEVLRRVDPILINYSNNNENSKETEQGKKTIIKKTIMLVAHKKGRTDIL